MKPRITKHLIPRQGLHQPVNVPLPAGADVLSACTDGVRPVIYVRGEGEPTEPRWFRLLWTSEEWPRGARFIGTVKVVAQEGGAEVWHLVELTELAGKEIAA
jgi:hypothetical protein